MDNVTHSLIGYALGRAATSTRSRAEQRVAVWASAIASNAPDFDFVIGPLSTDPKLAYLAHHRGHTHTLLFAIPIGLVVAELCLRALKLREPGARVRLYALCALAGLLHIGFDALNNYGVHPFFPLDNRWYYGDAVFIIEPLLFAALLPLVTLGGFTRVGRAIGALLCVLLLALVWGVALVPLFVAIISTASLGASLRAHAVLMRARPSAGPWAALAAAALVVGLFIATGSRARAGFEAHLATQAPSEQLAQLVLTPMPASPMCWSALAVTTDASGTYRARFGHQSLWPALVTPEECRVMPRGETTAPLASQPLASGAHNSASNTSIAFDQTFEGPLAELRALAAAHCDVRILLQFARVPFWIAGGAGVPVVGDLRYDNERDHGFSELSPRNECHDLPVPWVPPLHGLLH